MAVPHAGKRRASWLPFILVVGASILVLGAIVTWIVVSPQLTVDQDATALRALLRRELPAGATLADTRRVLSAGDVSRFLASHGYNDPIEDLPFQRVRSYNAFMIGSQVYPAGSMFEASVSQNWDTYIELNFFFDHRGHLLRCETHGYTQFAIG